MDVRNFGYIACFAGLCLFTATAAVAQGSDPAPATPVATPAPAAPSPPASAATADPNKLICRTMPPETGTRLGARRKCQTQAEWDDRERADEQALMKIQSQGFQTHTGNGS